MAITNDTYCYLYPIDIRNVTVYSDFDIYIYTYNMLYLFLNVHGMLLLGAYLK